jgi:hypothetical protein
MNRIGQEGFCLISVPGIEGKILGEKKKELENVHCLLL